MTERLNDRREKDFDDEIPDEEEIYPEPYEKPYRDGSARHECAADD